MDATKIIDFTAKTKVVCKNAELPATQEACQNPNMPAPEQPANTPPGSNIRTLRKSKGLTLAALAELCDLDAGTISRIERNLQYEKTTLEKIASGLGVELSDLFGDSHHARWKVLPTSIREDIIDYAENRIALWERKKKHQPPTE